MRSKEVLIGFGLFVIIAFLFFFPFFTRGWLPFPGDLLVGQYAPWNSYSYLGYAPGGVPHKAQGIDVVRQLFPWRYFSTLMLKAQQLPLWNPYNFSGNPLLANFQSAVFYPLGLIFLILPFNLAWSIFIISQNVLAGFFLWLFLRELKISLPAAFLGSLAFVYGLYFTVWMEYGNIGQTLLWLPLCLFLVEKIIGDFKRRWVILFLLSLTSSILAGYIQTTIYLFGVVYLYFFARLIFTATSRKIYKMVVVLVGGLLAFLLCGLQILPTWEIFQNSARGAFPLSRIHELLLPWFAVVGAFVPDFFGNPASRNYWLEGTYIERVLYIGVIPLFFAFWAIFRHRKKKLTPFFIFLLFLVLLLLVDFFPARFFYQLRIPIISTTVPTRLLSVFAFALAVLAAFGADDYLRLKNNRSVKIAGLIFVGFYVFLGLFTVVAPFIFPGQWWLGNLRISQRNLILPGFFAFLGAVGLYFSDRLSKKLILSFFTLIMVFDLAFYFNKITPFSPPKFVYPQTAVMEYLEHNSGINRFWGYGTGYIESNFSTLLQNYSIEGYDPLFVRRYGELISTSVNGKIQKPIPRADVNLTKGYGADDLRSNYFRQKLMNLLGIKYVLQKNEMLKESWQPDYQTFPSEIYQLVWQQGYWQVYENKKALPRAFLVGDYRVETDGQKIIDLLFQKDFDLQKQVVLEKRLTNFDLNPGFRGEIEYVDYQPNSVRLKAKTSGNCLLFLSDNYFPGWQAEVDGQKVEIYRANYTFRAIPLVAGDHQVTFSYHPASLKSGAIVSVIGLALTVVGNLVL